MERQVDNLKKRPKSLCYVDQKIGYAKGGK